MAIIVAAMGIGAPLTVSFEGQSLVPYYDSVGVRTVCHGETEHVEDRQYTTAECKDRFDIQYGFYSFATARMYNSKAQSVLTPEIHAAMTDMSYNVGLGAVEKSTMIKELNAGNPAAACNAILLYNKAGGRDCRVRSNNCFGVWDRRLKIHKLCMKGVQNG
jgi:lysozyme